MKAKEYFNRDIESIKNALDKKDQDKLDSIVRKVYVDFINEVEALIKKRNVKFDRGLHAIIKEQNIKWNALCSLVEKEIGFPVFVRDQFKAAIYEMLKKRTDNEEDPE